MGFLSNVGSLAVVLQHSPGPDSAHLPLVFSLLGFGPWRTEFWGHWPPFLLLTCQSPGLAVAAVLFTPRSSTDFSCVAPFLPPVTCPLPFAHVVRVPNRWPHISCATLPAPPTPVGLRVSLPAGSWLAGCAGFSPRLCTCRAPFRWSLGSLERRALSRFFLRRLRVRSQVSAGRMWSRHWAAPSGGLGRRCPQHTCGS